MKVFLTGGTGFVGSEVLRQLTEAGHEVRALVRPGSEGKLSLLSGVEILRGDVTDPPSLEGAMGGCDALVHLVGIIRESPSRGITFRRLHAEATANVVAAAQNQGVMRYLHMSANGTRVDASSGYHRTKWEAEETVRSSELEWTIFRPSLIFGPGDEFVNMLAPVVRTMPIVPVIGDGRYRMSPVAVEDVAAGFVRTLGRPDTSGKIFHCCGPETLSYDEILDRIGEALGKNRVRKLHQPAALIKPLISMFSSIPRFPITRAQLTMLLEGNVCDPAPWAQALGLELHPFSEGIRRYVK
jgi:uncharacterized protein YbjT (DUF2867 family)